jgi:formate dehydrogenase gamma subunit
VSLFGLFATLGLALVPPAPQNADCLACHGEKRFKSDSGRSLHVDGARQKASVHGILACRDCHSDIKEYPHPKHVTGVECATCHVDEAAAVSKSIHGAVLGKDSCTSCHGDPHENQSPGTTPGQECSACHSDVLQEFQSSVHGRQHANGSGAIATCQSCHGKTHAIVAREDPASPVSKHNLASTCGSCHANPQYLSQHVIPFARPVEAYRLSVHGRAVAAGNNAAASCSDCHGVHGILPARDPKSKINHWNVPQTCGACHTQIRDTYLASIHGQAMREGVADAPVCTDCHGEHNILAPGEPQSLVNPARVSTVTCGRCHTDERLAKRYNLPLDKVPAYEDSYHGLAMRAGSQTVANCASCHGVHNIFPSNDPRSTVNSANLAKTCGACHPGAGSTFAIGPVHVRPESASEHPVVRWIRIIYWVLIPLTVLFMVFHNAADFIAKLLRHEPRVETGQEVPRMNLHFRIEHWLVVVSFPVLVATGFALKFPESWWARPLVQWESRFAFRGTLHRVAAVVLIASLVYHAIHLIVSRRDRAIMRAMIPGKQDLLDLGGVLRFNLGLTRERPQFGKFSYGEKIEYLAFIWGMAVMSLSGLLLWFNNFTLRYFPKWVADAATAVHYYEAILATLAILLWHFYSTIFDPDVYPLDRSWLTGKASADHLRHTRSAYLHALSGKAPAKETHSDDLETGKGEGTDSSRQGKDQGEESGS